MTDKKRYNLYLQESVVAGLKKHADKQGISLSALINKLLSEVKIDKRKKR